MTCPRCSGKGSYPVGFRTATCFVCDGKGRTGFFDWLLYEAICLFDRDYTR